jgi:predicted AAA+ superfamily ATPase
LGFNIPAQQLQRFWLMLAHYHGQVFNASELARSLAISDHSVRRYLDILAGTFMMRVLPPWFENLEKRQVKSPKIYFRDSGILHALVGITNMDQLQTNPKLGAFWEGFALEEVIHVCRATSSEAYFWAINAGAELDLLIVKNGKRFGFEIKYVDVPTITKSMHAAQELLKLDYLGIIFPGKEIFPLSHGIYAYGLETLISGDFEKRIRSL